VWLRTVHEMVTVFFHKKMTVFLASSRLKRVK
jgi:hypothetical protein